MSATTAATMLRESRLWRQSEHRCKSDCWKDT
jgi:hypothetical protein